MHLPANVAVAFKEWAVVCAALQSGQQTILFRKGGIHEGREGFRVEHREFWLYPTKFHQGADSLTAAAEPLLRQVQAEAPPPGEFHLRSLAVVEQVRQLTDETELDRYTGQHIYEPATLQQRFRYRQPGLFVLLVRMYQQAALHVVVEDAAMAGCKSWVELPKPLPTASLQPVLDDATFEREQQRFAK